MRRLTAWNVFFGFVTAWRFAGWPTSTSPSFVKATTDGVVRSPSLFSRTLGVAPSITETQEFVVPRSMPMILAMSMVPSVWDWSGSGAAREGFQPLGGLESGVPGDGA